MNKGELIDAVAAQAGLPKPEAARAVEALFGTDGVVVRELRVGNKVQITGFGAFHARARAARTGRDPRTGASIPIAAAVIPAFKPGQQLKDALNPSG